ncbi:cysteine--tRNA ligase-like [Xyrauchen texanus]|uniref:cysteine--tRNA ligase-like n=1 Tax=Xyrauchen texanus TaxID=154827 RepID=UPI002242A5C0|nr:cysteine--tRNA ligase-like [Xyrauchen texanus]
MEGKLIIAVAGFPVISQTARSVLPTLAIGGHQRQRIGRYSCGPTVYDHAHLGHACTYVRFDILQRILSRLFGINVIHVMVITDIDDKIIQRSLEENISPTILARMYEEDFKRDMQALRVLPPAVYMRVTENISHIIAFTERIIGNGHAYVTSQVCKHSLVMDEQDREKRTVKMTEKAVEEHKSRQLHARRYKLSQLTSMIKQIEQLMEDDANADIVKNKLRVDFSGLQQELADLNSVLRRFMSDEEFLDDQRNWFDLKNKSINDFFWKCEEWMKEVMKRSEQAEECDKRRNAHR